MKVRELIEILAKRDWEAEVTIRDKNIDEEIDIDSISNFHDKKGTSKVTINFDRM